jgi:FkbM family methyltransferase
MIDVGANIGNHTIYLAKYCATEVLAFEPFPDTYRIFYNNIIENGLSNAIPFQYGLSNETKEVFMKSVKGNAGMNKIDEKGDVWTEVQLLDDYTFEEPITLIKLDCEGYEEKALLGMIETIKKHKPALFIECQTIDEDIAISNILIPLGYKQIKKFNATPTYYWSI